MAVAAGLAQSVSAANFVVEPDYPVHGNKCGTVIVAPELDRDVHVMITQLTEDGDYKYYDTIIPAEKASDSGSTFTFQLEGKNDVSYVITVGVPKLKGTDEFQYYSYEFNIADTDFITDGSVTGYSYNFSILPDSTAKEPSISIIGDTLDENKVMRYIFNLTFPVISIVSGDVDFNGKVDLYDAIAVAKYIAKSGEFTPEQFSAADYDENGDVNLYDLIAIARTLVH